MCATPASWTPTRVDSSTNGAGNSHTDVAGQALKISRRSQMAVLFRAASDLSPFFLDACVTANRWVTTSQAATIGIVVRKVKEFAKAAAAPPAGYGTCSLTASARCELASRVGNLFDVKLGRLRTCIP